MATWGEVHHHQRKEEALVAGDGEEGRPFSGKSGSGRCYWVACPDLKGRGESWGPGSGAGLERKWVVEQEKAVDSPVGLSGSPFWGYLWAPGPALGPARLGRSCSSTPTPTLTMYAGLAGLPSCPWQGLWGPRRVSLSLSLFLCPLPPSQNLVASD